jgi:hypothetical protein
MTNSIKDFNLGGYLQVGGTSVTLTVGSDGLTMGLGGQLSVGYTISGTTNINYSLSVASRMIALTQNAIRCSWPERSCAS